MKHIILGIALLTGFSAAAQQTPSDCVIDSVRIGLNTYHPVYHFTINGDKTILYFENGAWNPRFQFSRVGSGNATFYDSNPASGINSPCCSLSQYGSPGYGIFTQAQLDFIAANGYSIGPFYFTPEQVIKYGLLPTNYLDDNWDAILSLYDQCAPTPVDTVVVTETIVEYVDVPVYVTDTVIVTTVDTVTDTLVVIETDTLIEYVEVEVEVPVYITDTLVVVETDTVVEIETVIEYVDVPVYITDTVVVVETDTLIEYVDVPVYITDTVTVTEYVDVIVEVPVYITDTVTVVETVIEYVEVPLDNSCPQDLNGDGIISTSDLLLFFIAFGLECPE